MSVPRYRLPYSEEDIAWAQEELGALLRRGYLTQGPYLERFEEAFAEVSGARHNLAVANGTAALEMLYWVHGAHEGSVVVPTNTFFAGVVAALNIGARVVLADIDPMTMAPTAEEIARRLRPDTRVVCLTHIAGVVTPQFDAIRSLCRERGVILLEDAAHAHGATYRGRPAGSLADGAAFSMHHSKVLTSGEGGFVCFDDDGLLTPLKRRRFIGLDIEVNNWEIHLVGQNYKVSEATCILGLIQLRRWRDLVAQRRQAAAIYDTRLADTDLLVPVHPAEGDDHGLYKYVVMLAPDVDKRAFMAAMAEHAIDLPPNVYDHPCHTQKAAAHPGILNAGDAFPGTEAFVARHVCLPMYAGLTEAEANEVATAALAAAQAARRVT